MDKIDLKHNIHHDITVLPNDFIDHYMIKADGEYVKIYLLIQRLIGENIPIQVDYLADRLELTRKDILRALNYWEKEGLLTLGGKSETEDTPADAAPSTTSAASPSISIGNHPVPEKMTRNATDMEQSIRGTDLEQTIYMAETYLGRPLSVSELNSFCYIHDTLHFSADLLEYLIEYCITKGKKSVRYIESVAINWYQQGIDTVPKAKEQSTAYTKNVFPIMKAFGIAGRNPGPAEMEFITKWNTLGFGTDIIVEACNRTLLTTHQASFPYANRILEDWKKAGVRNAADIRTLDRKHQAAAQQQSAATQQAAASAVRRPAARGDANSFHNFEQRSYDYDNLESRLLDKNSRR